MSYDDIAIRVRDLSKCYQIYGTPRDRLKQFVVPRLQRFARQIPKQYFREFWALKDVSFDVKKGETVGIVGRNGSGKSTLLQLICGTLNPTSGSIQTSGRIAALLELGSGFNFEFSGRDNIFLNAAVLGLTREETEQRFDDIAAFADIGDFMEQPVKTYSSGMVVRLAFAVQAMVEPEILIVDEALAVGDEKFQRKCFARLEELRSNGTSILFVSHSGPQVVELCDRALLLEQGERVMCAQPAPVIRSYQRLIYAPNSEQLRLLQAFREGNATGSEDESDRVNEIALEAKRTTIKLDDAFDPALVPETKMVYPVQGAEIERIEIQNVTGKVVNMLRPRERYRIVMTGYFLADFEKVFFGVHVRSISGAVLSGQRYPEEGRFIEAPRAGAKFRIDFWFDMALLPDTYFAGGGIWSATDPSCAHRILDAIMFRIQNEGPQSSFGYCNLMATPAEFEMA